MVMRKWLAFSFKQALVASVLAGLGLGGLLLTIARAAEGDTLVIFTTNWSASSRSVLPIARDVASQNNLKVEQIDVDDQSAPGRSQKYGISIPKGELPQVFVIRNKRAVKIYDGGRFRPGDEDTVRATILQGLQPGR